MLSRGSVASKITQSVIMDKDVPDVRIHMLRTSLQKGFGEFNRP